MLSSLDAYVPSIMTLLFIAMPFRYDTDETIANIAITLIHQEDVILRRYLDYIKEDFLKHGGIREQMTKARIEYRNKQ